jgi:hypothetical protein
MAAQHLWCVAKMLVGVFFVVDVVDEPDDAPHLLVGPLLPGDVPHGGLDRQRVGNKVGVFYVIVKVYVVRRNGNFQGLI